MDEYDDKHPSNEGLISLGDVDEGEQYEWDVTEVWYDPETKWFWVYSDSGCSCNWAYDNYTSKADLSGPFRSLSDLTGRVPLRLIDKIIAGLSRVDKEND